MNFRYKEGLIKQLKSYRNEKQKSSIDLKNINNKTKPDLSKPVINKEFKHVYVYISLQTDIKKAKL